MRGETDTVLIVEEGEKDFNPLPSCEGRPRYAFGLIYDR